MYEIGSVTRYDGEGGEWLSAVAAVEAELRAIADRSAAKKQEIEVLREERRVINAEMDPWFEERRRLYAVRGIVPGDVVVGGAA